MTNNFDNLSPITPLNIGYHALRDIAESIASKTQLRTVRDFSLVIQGLGGKIIHQDPAQWGLKEARSLEVFGSKNFHVYMPKSSGDQINNLIYASALGHYFLHAQEGKKPLYVLRFEQDLANLEGLWFALSLLIPDRTFELAQAQQSSSDAALAQMFQVNEPVIKLKRKILNNVAKYHQESSDTAHITV